MNLNSILKYLFLSCAWAFVLFGNNIAQAQVLQDQARVQYYESKIEDEQLPITQKVQHYDSIISYYNNHGQSDLAYNYSLEKMKGYYKEGYYLETYKTGLSIIDSFNEKEISIEEQSIKGMAHLLIGKCCINLGMFDEGISNLFSIVRMPESPYMIEANSYLGFLFMQMGQMEKSKNYNDMAKGLLAQADSIFFSKSASVVYNNLGGYYYNIPQLDSALYFLNQSLDYYDFAENLLSKSFIYHNMAIIYLEMNEYSMAEDYLRKAIDISDKEPYNIARYLQNLAFVLMQSNRIAEAEAYYYKALDAANSSNIERVKSAVLIELSDIFYKKKQYQKAWEYLKEGMILRDSLYSSQDMEKVSLLSQQLDNYKITSEKELLEKELQLAQLANQKKNIILGVLIFAFLVISAITYLQIKRIYKNSTINIKKGTRDAEKSLREEYESTLDEKNRKLASNALYLMKTNEVLTILDKNIKQLSVWKDPDKRNEIIKEMEMVVNFYNSGQGWEEFKLYFEQIHPSFYTNLNNINPELSKMQQRLCALLVLNMSTKEIAEMTNRSIRTIETLLYRLRKSLDIPTEEKTVVFLRKLL